MVTLGVSSTVLPPSLIRTQLSKPIFSLSFSPNLVKNGKSNFKNLTSLSPSVSTEAASPLEEDNDSVDQGDMFEWFSQWYALMPVCDLDKRVPLGKKVMGLDVVVWWDKNEDSWKVFDDRCPHRLAPLSEGRIDQWGRLQCVYHGWCFGGSGDCKVIPQAPRDGPPVHTFPKACAAVYPSTVQYGIVWFWPNSDPQFKDILTKKKPPYIAELDDPSFSYLMFNKDMPIGALPLSGTKWLKKYAGDQVDWGNRFDGSLPPTPPKEQLMDRYWTHVVNCSSCNAAYKALNALVLSLQVFSVTTVAIVAATNQQMISGVARHMLVGSAVLCFAGSKWLSHFIYKIFHYHDYNHASQ